MITQTPSSTQGQSPDHIDLWQTYPQINLETLSMDTASQSNLVHSEPFEHYLDTSVPSLPETTPYLCATPSHRVFSTGPFPGSVTQHLVFDDHFLKDQQYDRNDTLPPCEAFPQLLPIITGPSPTTLSTGLTGAPVAKHLSESASDTMSTSSSFSFSGDPDLSLLVPHPKVASRSSLQPQRSRRGKTRIALAPDQPMTAQGKPRTRVFLACIPCRDRKIRCDGAKPVCYNCKSRTRGDASCVYDAAPTRRGPDRNPGSRQRMAVEIRNRIEDGLIDVPHRRKRMRVGHVTTAEGQRQRKGQIHRIDFNLESSPDNTCSLEVLPPTQNVCIGDGLLDTRSDHLRPLPCASFGKHNTIKETTRPQARVQRLNEHMTHLAGVPSFVPAIAAEDISDGCYHGQFPFGDITTGPSLNFHRKIWWDSLLSLYYSPTSKHLTALHSPQRDAATRGITADLRFLFQNSNYWFSFFHTPSFYDAYSDPCKRLEMQPSLVLALLATSTFWQSSEIERGAEGREKAIRLRDEAQAALDASLYAGRVDETLAQAAWVLAMFEISAHPCHSTERSKSAMMLLDSIIRSLKLTFVDAHDPLVSRLGLRSVPVVRRSSFRGRSFENDVRISRGSGIDPASHRGTYVRFPSYMSGNVDNSPSSGCHCASVTLGSTLRALDYTPLWNFVPAWTTSSHEGEIRKESCRRLCWSSIMLAAGHISYSSACKTGPLDLFIANPTNHALLLNGESIMREARSLQSSKESIWALHDRTFLLWHSCMQMWNDPLTTDAEKAEFAVNAWIEADNLEAALNRHTCDIEKPMLFQGREYLFNTRMAISYDYQRYIPIAPIDFRSSYRNSAEDWLRHQAVVVKRFMAGLHTVTGNATHTLARRPFYLFWFLAQISRALTLWDRDHTLPVALEVCKAFLPVVEFLSGLWPCPEQRLRYQHVRERLQRECEIAGLDPIPPADYTMPFRVDTVL